MQFLSRNNRNSFTEIRVRLIALLSQLAELACQTTKAHVQFFTKSYMFLKHMQL